MRCLTVFFPDAASIQSTVWTEQHSRPKTDPRSILCRCTEPCPDTDCHIRSPFEEGFAHHISLLGLFIIEPA